MYKRQVCVCVYVCVCVCVLSSVELVPKATPLFQKKVKTAKGKYEEE